MPLRRRRLLPEDTARVIPRRRAAPPRSAARSGRAWLRRAAWPIMLCVSAMLGLALGAVAPQRSTPADEGEPTPRTPTPSADRVSGQCRTELGGAPADGLRAVVITTPAREADRRRETGIRRDMARRPRAPRHDTDDPATADGGDEPTHLRVGGLVVERDPGF